ncbi:MAG: ECF-type sigma factor [Acidobacteriota bacterium]
MTTDGDQDELAGLLRDLRDGRVEARDRLIELVHDELRAIAGALMRSERRGHSLQPTALLSEAWLRLFGDRVPEWNDRRHFFAVAASTMRRVLVDHARERAAEKRGAGWHRLSLDSAGGGAVSGPQDVDVLALHQALERLQELHERQARVIELRWFGGLTLEEAAEELQVSSWTVKQDWLVGRAWLERELTRTDVPPSD